MDINNKDFPFPLASWSAAAAKGMSGGPIYGEDGKILGITLGKASGKIEFHGNVSEYSAKHLPRISLGLTYSDIKKEWEKFLEEKNKKEASEA